MRGSRNRRLALAALCATSLAIGWAVLERGGRTSAPTFVTEPVVRGAIAATVTATGVVEPTVTVQVGTYVSGPILALYADFNSPVKRGQRVAKIDPAPFEVKVRGAEAKLATARAATDKARADLARKQLSLGRSRELRRSEFLSQDALDAAVSDAAQALAQVAVEEAGARQAEAALEEARVQLAYTDIVSPVDGVVISRTVDVGQTVAASFQTPTLFQIAEDLAKMQVRASVSESDIGSIAIGQRAAFRVDAWPGRRFAGRTVQVRAAPVTVQNVVTYDVVIAVGNADLALLPGMTATVEITTASEDDVLRIPLRALRFRPDTDPAAPGDATRPVADAPEQPGAFVAENGVLRRVALRTGIRDERYAQILDGDLAAGDAVVVAYAPSEAPATPAGGGSPFGPRRFR